MMLHDIAGQVVPVYSACKSHVYSMYIVQTYGSWMKELLLECRVAIYIYEYTSICAVELRTVLRRSISSFTSEGKEEFYNKQPYKTDKQDTHKTNRTNNKRDKQEKHTRQTNKKDKHTGQTNKQNVISLLHQNSRHEHTWTLSSCETNVATLVRERRKLASLWPIRVETSLDTAIVDCNENLKWTTNSFVDLVYWRTDLQVSPDERFAFEILEIIPHQQIQENSSLWGKQSKLLPVQGLVYRICIVPQFLWSGPWSYSTGESTPKKKD